MNNEKLTITSAEHLFAQVYAMKCESEDRLQDLIDSLQQHNNSAAAEIFSRTLELIQGSIKNIEQRTQGMQFPQIPPWEAQWHCEEQADYLCIENAHYLMTSLQALELAILNEKRFQAFFKQQIDIAVNKKIRHMADDFLTQEKQLTKQMHSWKKQLESSSTEYNEDFDPPNIPE